MTELLYLKDAFATSTTATVTSADDGVIVLDQTILYATGGGQPHDTGKIAWDGGSATVTDVRKKGANVQHVCEGDLPAVGTEVTVTVDWERRHQLMRTHTALHILCGVIWNEWGVQVTGGNMEPLKARMDFEFNPLPEGFRDRITELVNAEISADRPIAVDFLPRGEALLDEDLIRTKVNLIPEFVTEIRTVDIVGLDKQADGGTHLASTGDVGRFEVAKIENKGKGNKRVRMVLHDTDDAQ
jgi:misacylated tRNA(Ala) deacylase